MSLLSHRDDSSEGQCFRNERLGSPVSNGVRVLPTASVGSEFDPCQFTNRDIQSQTVRHDYNHWRMAPPTRNDDEIQVNAGDYDSCGTLSSSSNGGHCPRAVVWNWKPREGLTHPEGKDDALQIIPGKTTFQQS